MGTAAVAASAEGSLRAVELKPITLTVTTWTQRSNGGLSIEALADGSKAP